MRELFCRVDVLGEQLRAYSNRVQPGFAAIDPFAIDLWPSLFARIYEILDLHLLEFTRAEDEIARCDLVAEGLAYLSDAETGF